MGKRTGTVVLAMAATVAPVRADEGLWTFEDFPAAKIGAAHGFAPDQAWLDRLRAGTLSLGGCSASIVGASGLVLTNHHCVESCIAALAPDGQDVQTTPVIARTEAEERPCPGQEAYAVTDITDVTARLRAVEAGLPLAEADAARSAEVERLVAACENGAEDRWCDVAPLHSGGIETLYGYKRFTDVRLVLGPESTVGSFGGDPDNFSFPRYAWDAAFLRLYEQGRPAVTPQRLKMRFTPLAEGELVFVSGFPGDTGRQGTLLHAAMYTDTYYPLLLALDAEIRGRILAKMDQGEAPRGFASLLAERENNFKRNWTELAALRSPGFRDQLSAREAQFRADLTALPQEAAKVARAMAAIDTAMVAARRLFIARHLAEYEAGDSALWTQARQIVRAAFERRLPEEQRLPDYSDASIADLRDQLAVESPAFPERDELVIGFWLSKLREHLSTDHPMVRAALGKDSPEGLAHRAVAETGLASAEARLALFDGGYDAVIASTDPMIRLMVAIEPEARAAFTRYRDAVVVPREDAERVLNEARFALYGKTVYPDALGTLRLNAGVVGGWTEPDGRAIPAFTDFSGLIERATGAPPFQLAPLWDAAKSRLDPATIFDVATTNDTIGGNSGSPAVDRDGRVVGAMFDGNIHSTGGYYQFDPRLNRTVLVAATAIREGLDKVYGLDRVIAEMEAE